MPKSQPLSTIKLGEYLKRNTKYTSRNKIKKILRSRRVIVNGVVEVSMARKISPQDFIIKVLSLEEAETRTTTKTTLEQVTLPTILVLNKPCNVVCTFNDEKSRVCVNSLFPEKLLKSGIHPIGRLDQHSTGLLLFTTDGKLTQYLLNPTNHVKREYCCIVQGVVNDFKKLKLQLHNGIETRWGKFYGELLESERIGNINETIHEHWRQHLIKCNNNKRFTRQDGPNPLTSSVPLDETKLSMIKIAVSEGKKRIIRRMLAYCNLPVLNLFRYKFGCIQMDHNLNPGKYRELTAEEKQWVKSLPIYSN